GRVGDVRGVLLDHGVLVAGPRALDERRPNSCHLAPSLRGKDGAKRRSGPPVRQACAGAWPTFPQTWLSPRAERGQPTRLWIGAGRSMLSSPAHNGGRTGHFRGCGRSGGQPCGGIVRSAFSPSPRRCSCPPRRGGGPG